MTELALTTEHVPIKDLRREYIAGPGRGWYVDRLQSLPPFVDDLTAELGDDLYERMSHDPMVAAALNVIGTGALEESIGLLPAVDDATLDGYQESKELVDFCEPVLAALTNPLDDVLYDLLSGALAYGNRVAEQVYDLDHTYTGRSQIILKALKPKPRRSTAFVVDQFLNVHGLLGYVNGEQKILPRERFAVVTFRPKDSDPRGRSILRAAYNAYELKVRTWPEYLKYLVQFASPSLFATTAQGAEDVQLYTSDGQPSGQYISAVNWLLNEIIRFQNGSAIAAPFGTEIKELFSQGDGKAFLEAFKLYNREIAMAIVSQTRALLESEYGSRADSETASDVLARFIRQLKRSLCLMLRRDVLTPLVRYNFGDQVARLAPYATLGETTNQNWGADLAAAASAGYGFHPSQLPALDERFNVPVRDANTVIDAPDMGSAIEEIEATDEQNAAV